VNAARLRQLATRAIVGAGIGIGIGLVTGDAAAASAPGPDDPQYAQQWHLPKINAPQAWDLTRGSAEVVIAIVDSGVDPFHPDLAGKFVAGINTHPHDKPANTADQFGHGTKMAGAAAALSNNGVGIAGLAPRARIMPIRVTDRAGSATAQSIAQGITWAADHGARVINVSMEGVIRNATVRSAAEYAFRHGALVVAPSGNCGCTDASSDTPYILSVSATDEHDRIVPSSTTGAFVDLAAPGENIPTTAMYGVYLSESGTSMASAVVAGVAALMVAANRDLTPAEVTELLQRTAVRPHGSGRDPRYGHGRVDAYAAVKAAADHRPGAHPAADLARAADGDAQAAPLSVSTR
jgi:subtilisin family serine protease